MTSRGRLVVLLNNEESLFSSFRLNIVLQKTILH